MRYLVFIAILLLVLGVRAQEEIAEKKKNVKILAVVLPARSPDFGWHLQGGGIAGFSTDTSDASLRESNCFLSVLVSEYGQYVLSVGNQIFTPKEKYYIEDLAYFSYSPELFFPLGRKNTDADSEKISSNLTSVGVRVLRKVIDSLYAGGSCLFEKESNLEFSEYGAFEKSQLQGKNGYALYGFGLNVRYDSRNELLWTSQGFYMDFSLQFIRQAKYSFNKLLFDLRYFTSAFIQKKDVLGLMFMYSSINKKDAFYRQWPSITSRAFHPNMLKFTNMCQSAIDYQFPLWKAFNGSVFYEPSVGKSDKWLFFNSYGGGVRFLLSSEKLIYIRAEYAISSFSENFHFSFTGAF